MIVAASIDRSLRTLQTFPSMHRFFSLFVLVFTCLMSGLTAREMEAPAKRTALIIGNARYEAAAGPLRNTVNDARAMARTLKSLGFTVHLHENVTRDQLLKALLDFRGTLAGKEVALFYFAGHGISISGANYLLPIKSGYEPEGADDITLRLLAETKLFNVEQAVADLKSGGAHCNLIILDACRTTAMARTGRTRDAAGTPGGLAEMKPPAGSLIAFATDAGQTALDGEGENGLYTEELLRHLNTQGLTIEQVFKRTRAAVLERSQGQQIPSEYSRLIGDDIFLAGSAVEPEAMPAAPAATVVKALPLEVSSWAQIRKLSQNTASGPVIQALMSRAEAEGAENEAADVLTTLLDQAKEALKKTPLKDAEAKETLSLCEKLILAIPVCLPKTNARYDELLSKAHNRRGDSLLLIGQADEALEAFNAAQVLAPDDAYILYNRARAHQALGDKDNARADFTSAADPKFNQPKARELALKALAELK